jgi:hypothetical protein
MSTQMPIPIIDADSSKMPSLLTFFKHKAHFDVLLEFIIDKKKSNQKLSLNLLEWFVINYSKHYGVVYDFIKNERKRQIFVWIEYEAALGGNHKKSFDIFNRNQRDKKNKKVIKTISLEYHKDCYLKTTVAQLNFFRWAIKNGVIDYLKSNISVIHADMKNRSKKKIIGSKKPLSVSVSKTLGVHKIKTSIKFKTIARVTTP